MSRRSSAVHVPAEERSAPGSILDPAMTAFVRQLRQMSIRGLARMYDPKAGLYVFRVRPGTGGLVQEGSSPRYTAITLLGLATETRADALRATAPHTPDHICARLLETVVTSNNLGDVALSLWAADAMGQATSTAWRAGS